MTTYNVDRKKLIETIKENRDAHRAIFLKAQDGYRKKAIEVFEERLAAMRNGDKVITYVSLTEPRDYTEEYDMALAALEWDIRNVIEISQADFNKWVLNKWDWVNQFVGSTQAYLVE